MAHDCPDCGELCYCDGEDHGQEAPDDCEHACEPERELEDIYDEQLEAESRLNGYY
jgi:hypothetical protein